MNLASGGQTPDTGHMNSGSLPRPAISSGLLLLGALCLGTLVRSCGPSFLSACFLPIPVFEGTGMLALVAGLAGAVIFHEVGHLFAALASDFEVSGIVLGPFRIARRGNSWVLNLKTKRLFEASVSAFPKTETHWRRRMITVAIAGPLATFLTGLAAISWLHLGGVNDWLLWFLRAFAQVSFFIFVLGLLPNSRLSACLNDAALLRSLWRMDSQANEMFLYHLVLQQQRMGIRPGLYPPTLIQRLTRFQGRPDFMAFFATTLAVCAFDRDDLSTANDWDQQALTLSSQGSFYSRSLVRVNSACFDIVYRENFTSARKKLAELDVNKIVSPCLKHRARAMGNLTAGQITETLADIAAARFALPEHLRDAGMEYLLLKQLHAVTLTVRPADLSSKAKLSSSFIVRQTSPVVI